nr:MAG TPA: antirepressor protein [Caudoviricetes sp.]DAS42749.1 MAG TPA: antirepressor protein [Caudoviricetes sp.]
MTELIKIDVNENQEPVISGRALHSFLEVATPYDKWFPRMVEYGFTDGLDFSTFLSESTGGRPATDHAIRLDMAKEIAMIQRSEKGKQARQYFIQIEKDYNSPEKIMARALQIAEKELSNLRLENKVQEQQIAELKPKASYYDLVLQCKDLLSMTEIAKDYGMSAKGMNKLLHDLGVQYKQSGIWFLYSKYQSNGYTQTKTQNYSKPDGSQGVTTHTYWTQKGRLFLYELLKANEILPMIEIEAA